MNKKNLLFLFLLCANFSFSQTESVFKVKLPDSTQKFRQRPSLDIDRFWKYQSGDNKQWADPLFNDKSWVELDPRLKVKELKPGQFEGIGWFRIHLQIDSSAVDRSLALMMVQDGASEVYLDGKLLHTFGKIDADPTKEERYNPLLLSYEIRFKDSADHVLAIRYSNRDAIANEEKGAIGFSVKLGDLQKNIKWHYINTTITTVIFVFYFTFFLALGFLHLALFLYYKANRSNLYYSIFALAFGTTFLCIVMQQTYLDPDAAGTFDYIMTYLSTFYEPALLAMLYSIFYKKMPRLYWIWLVLFAIEFVSNIIEIEIPYYGVTLSIAFVVESLRMIISSMVKKRDGAWIIGSGIIFTVAFFTLYIVLALMGKAEFFNSQEGFLGVIVLAFVLYATLSIPASMTLYLAREFSRTSKDLQKQLVQVEELSARAIEQEKEKQQILANQNQMLEKQVKERTAELEEKNKEILDSIRYASRIQKSLLPNEKYITRVLNLLRGKR